MRSSTTSSLLRTGLASGSALGEVRPQGCAWRQAAGPLDAGCFASSAGCCAARATHQLPALQPSCSPPRPLSATTAQSHGAGRSAECVQPSDPTGSCQQGCVRPPSCLLWACFNDHALTSLQHAFHSISLSLLQRLASISGSDWSKSSAGAMYIRPFSMEGADTGQIRNRHSTTCLSWTPGTHEAAKWRPGALAAPAPACRTPACQRAIAGESGCRFSRTARYTTIAHTRMITSPTTASTPCSRTMSLVPCQWSTITSTRIAEST